MTVRRILGIGAPRPRAASDMVARVLSRASRRGKAGSVAAPWAPSDLSPDFWVRADLGHSKADGEVLDALANQGDGGTDWDLEQAAPGKQPEYVESSANGNNQAALLYTGAESLYAPAGTFWEVPAGSDLTVIVVCRPTYTGDKSVFATVNATTGGIRFKIRTNAASQVYVEDDSGNNMADNMSGLAINTLYALALVVNGADSPSNDTIEYWADGVGTGSPGSNDIGAIAPASGTRELVLGSNSTSGGHFEGEIFEALLLRRALTPEEDASLTTYLNARYGKTYPGVTQ